MAIKTLPGSPGTPIYVMAMCNPLKIFVFINYVSQNDSSVSERDLAA